ncbi:hypothetical protein pdam_00025655, partial [Pocillopora damicornis]
TIFSSTKSPISSISISNNSAADSSTKKKTNYSSLTRFTASLAIPFHPKLQIYLTKYPSHDSLTNTNDIFLTLLLTNVLTTSTRNKQFLTPTLYYANLNHDFHQLSLTATTISY